MESDFAGRLWCVMTPTRQNCGHAQAFRGLGDFFARRVLNCKLELPFKNGALTDGGLSHQAGAL
jgi:hypothetical protein